MEPIPSQIILVSCNNHSLQITLDSGATVSYIQLQRALSLDLVIKPNNQLALLADQQTRMASLGEVDFIVTLDNIQMRVRALVMKKLQAECFGGTTFYADNGIEANIKSGTICIHGKYVVKQSNPLIEVQLHPPDQPVLELHMPSASSNAQGEQLGPPVPLCCATPRN